MFSHLKKLDVAGATSWMDLPEVSPGARLHLRPAGQTNAQYLDALLRRSARRAKALARADQIKASDVAQNRDDDRDLYARHVLVGWEGILDENDQPVPFSRDNGLEFLRALPDYVFDRIRDHASTPERFLATAEDDPAEAPEELLGNSESGSSGS